MNTMKTRKLISISGIVLLALAVSAGIFILVYALQNPHLMINIATIGWNGFPIS